MSSKSRALHYVLKIGNLKKNVEFFRDKLQMKVLRHEVFDEGCEAACNGPYSNKWSKTMIGYGPEDTHFVLELTYNYSVGQYKLGNDLQYIKIGLRDDDFERLLAKNESDESTETGSTINLNSPDGYRFIVNRDANISKSDITEVCLSCSRLDASLKYWVDLLNMRKESQTDDSALLSSGENQANLMLKQLTEPLDHKTAYGRIAFSCPADDLKPIEALMQSKGHKILTPYISLDTPGKATVQVVILADPDGHEICFVGDKGFRDLSQVDSQANDLIEKSMNEDKSDEWFEKKGISKQEA